MDQPPVESSTRTTASQGQDEPQPPTLPLPPGPPPPTPGIPLPPKPNFAKNSPKVKWIAIGIVSLFVILWIIGVAIGPKKTTSTPQAKKTVPAQKTSAANSTTAKKQTETKTTPAPTTSAASTPSTTPQAQQVIDPNQYPAGSADRAFAEYLNAWGIEDWNKMYGLTQLTWRSEKDVEELQADYDFKGLETAKITSRSVVSETVVDFTADVTYKFGSEIKTEVMKARVIRESAPYKPDPNGTWGVNPISTL